MLLICLKVLDHVVNTLRYHDGVAEVSDFDYWIFPKPRAIDQLHASWHVSFVSFFVAIFLPLSNRVVSRKLNLHSIYLVFPNFVSFLRQPSYYVLDHVYICKDIEVA